MTATTTSAGTRRAPSLATRPAEAPVRRPPTGAVMVAATRRRYGTASEVVLSSEPVPEVDAGQVLLEVHAAGLDRGTEHLLTGRPWLLRLAGFGFFRPKQPVLGLDVAGTVVAVGKGVDRFDVGDEVFGIAEGSFAEYATAAQDKLVSKPADLTFAQAAVCAVSGITALEALTEVASVEPGQRVLVVGASGGVGTFAVQIAKGLGADVDGVASSANLGLVRSLGAATVVDYRTTDLAHIAERYDVVLDIGGRNPVRKLRGLLVADGTLVIVGGEHGNRVTGGIGRQLRAMAVSALVSQRLTTFISSESQQLIERLAGLLDDGSVAPVIGQQFPLSQTSDALEGLANGGLKGKTAIIVKEHSS